MSEKSIAQKVTEMYGESGIPPVPEARAQREEVRIDIITKSEEARVLAEEYFLRVKEMNEDIRRIIVREKSIEILYEKQNEEILHERTKRVEFEKQLEDVEKELLRSRKHERELADKILKLQIDYSREQEKVETKETELGRLSILIYDLEEELKHAQDRVEALNKIRKEQESEIKKEEYIIKQQEDELREALSREQQVIVTLEEKREQVHEIRKRELLTKLLIERELQEKELLIKLAEAEKEMLEKNLEQKREIVMQELKEEEKNEAPKEVPINQVPKEEIKYVQTEKLEEVPPPTGEQNLQSAPTWAEIVEEKKVRGKRRVQKRSGDNQKEELKEEDDEEYESEEETQKIPVFIEVKKEQTTEAPFEVTQEETILTLDEPQQENTKTIAESEEWIKVTKGNGKKHHGPADELTPEHRESVGEIE
jgi:hypothetical protein